MRVVASPGKTTLPLALGTASDTPWTRVRARAAAELGADAGVPEGGR